MDWWQLIVALVLITFYVIKHILTVQDQQKTRPRVEPVRERTVPVAAAKRDEELVSERTELDRRIERRRELDEVPAALPLPKPAIPMPAPPVVVRPVPRYQPPVRPLRPASTRPVVPVPAIPAPPVVVLAPAAPPAAATAAPAVRKVLELLRNRQTLASAVVLREILDPPLSRRRRW